MGSLALWRKSGSPDRNSVMFSSCRAASVSRNPSLINECSLAWKMLKKKKKSLCNSWTESRSLYFYVVAHLTLTQNKGFHTINVNFQTNQLIRQHRCGQTERCVNNNCKSSTKANTEEVQIGMIICLTGYFRYMHMHSLCWEWIRLFKTYHDNKLNKKGAPTVLLPLHAEV